METKIRHHVMAVIRLRHLTLYNFRVDRKWEDKRASTMFMTSFPCACVLLFYTFSSLFQSKSQGVRPGRRRWVTVSTSSYFYHIIEPTAHVDSGSSSIA